MMAYLKAATTAVLVIAISLILEAGTGLAQKEESGKEEYQLRIVSSKLNQKDVYTLQSRPLCPSRGRRWRDPDIFL